MTRDERREFLTLLEAHAQTVEICAACATTTRDLAAEVARGGLPARADLNTTIEEAERVLGDLASLRAELHRVIGELNR